MQGILKHSGVKFATALALMCLCALCAIGLTACSQEQTIGDKSDDAVSFALTNETGEDIESVAVKNYASTSYGAALTQEEALANGDTATLYCVEPEAAESNEGDTDDDAPAVALNALTDVQVTMTSGMVYELHQLNLTDIKDATIKLEGELAYLSYTSNETGEAVDTLDAEQAYQQQVKEAAAAKAAAEAKAKEEAEKKAAAEKAAKEKAAKEKAAASSQKSSSASSSSSNSSSSSKSSSSSSSSSSSNKSSSSSSSSSGNSSSEDACVDDLLLNE